jgi:hypothetical protein
MSARSRRTAKSDTRPRRSTGRGRSSGQLLFVREGEYWTIAYHGTVLRLRDGKGLRYLAELLGRPGDRVPALDLAAGGGRGAAQPDANLARLAVTKRIKAALQKITEHHPALGFHLASTVRTGRSCSYRPDPTEPISWTLSCG